MKNEKKPLRSMVKKIDPQTPGGPPLKNKKKSKKSIFGGTYTKNESRFWSHAAIKNLNGVYGNKHYHEGESKNPKKHQKVITTMLCVGVQKNIHYLPTRTHGYLYDYLWAQKTSKMTMYYYHDKNETEWIKNRFT